MGNFTFHRKGASLLAISILFATSSAFATEAISVDSPELMAGYSLYSDITGTEGTTTVQYGEGILNSLKNASKTCQNQAWNIWNNGETFVFSSCGFPNLTPPSFTANTNLLSLWQVGNEDIRWDITNKAKFSIYSKLFLALRHSYAYNKGYRLYEKDDRLITLNVSLSESIDKIKKELPADYMISHSGAYSITALSYLWSTPEIAPSFYYSEDQYNRYKKFENTLLTVAKKVQAIKDKKTLSKLETALLKVLKDTKGKMENDKYAMFMIIYQIVAEQNSQG